MDVSLVSEQSGFLAVRMSCVFAGDDNSLVISPQKGKRGEQWWRAEKPSLEQQSAISFWRSMKAAHVNAKQEGSEG